MGRPGPPGPTGPPGQGIQGPKVRHWLHKELNTYLYLNLSMASRFSFYSFPGYEFLMSKM